MPQGVSVVSGFILNFRMSPSKTRVNAFVSSSRDLGSLIFLLHVHSIASSAVGIPRLGGSNYKKAPAHDRRKCIFAWALRRSFEAPRARRRNRSRHHRASGQVATRATHPPPG